MQVFRLIGLFLGLFLAIFLIPKSAFLQSYTFNELIDSFEAKIDIQEDSSFIVEENIVYDFGRQQRHGIEREIPTSKIKISILEITDQNGIPYHYEVKKEFNLLKIRIGDPNTFVTGRHTYKIVYKVFGGILFFKDHDELYWNTIGPNWSVPIKKARTIISLPNLILPQDLNFACYTGPFGSKESNCEKFVDQEKKQIVFYTTSALKPKEAFTVVLGFPKGIVKKPTFWQKIFWNLSDYWPLLIPIFVFLSLFGIWWKKGKDPRINKAIMPFYEPPDNLRPMEIEAILKQKLNVRAISATLIDLAVRGYIKIKEIEEKGFLRTKKDYEIIKIKEFKEDPELHSYEKVLLNKIFGRANNVKLSEIKKEEKLYEELSTIFFNCFERLANEHYFVKNPKAVFDNWLLVGVLICFTVLAKILNLGLTFIILFWILVILFGPLERIYFKRKLLKENSKSQSRYLLTKYYSPVFLPIFFLFLVILFIFAIALGRETATGIFSNIIFSGSLILTGIIVIIFGRIMPKKTKKGAEAYWKILGFRDFIKTAEKYRAQFYEKENIFEEYLPYAIIFGLTDKWAKVFEGIYQKQPEWYESKNMIAFSTVGFISSLNQSLSDLNNAFVSKKGALGGASGLGGGGFSGGGFGGGGGGSW